MKYNLKVGIVCASDDELAPFLPHVENGTATKKAMLTVYEGEINGIQAAIMFSGVCKVNAAIATQILIDTYHADVIINAGTAGGMNEQLKIFDTVITTEACYHDVSEDVLTEFHPWMKNSWFSADSKLLDLSHKAMDKTSHTVFWGRTVTGEAFISDEGRERIYDTFKPLSVDMETAAIAHTCYVNNIPFIAIRTITDTAEHSGSENFEMNCEKASEIEKDITLALLSEIKQYGCNLLKPELQYRTLLEQEIDRKLFQNFIRRQVVGRCLRRENGCWKEKDDPFIDDWSEDDYQTLIGCLKNTVKTGGYVYAAFCNGVLKGFVSVESELFGGINRYLDLSSIHISEDMRRCGIGKTLFLAAKKWAREKGAKKLYISSHSAIETQAFYRAMGCVEAKEYNAAHVEAEPYDCQLECAVDEIER
jgi:adenosylhomocysteine nucleosidase